MNAILKTTKSIARRWDIYLCIAMAVFFYNFKELDIWVTGLFYGDGQFYLTDNIIVRAVYEVFGDIHLVLLFGFIGGLIFINRKTPEGQAMRKKFSYLLLVMVVGPGLLVNTLLKDNSVGRARPVNIVEFGGPEQHTAAFEYSGACDDNCSFSSGHAGIGFFFISLGWAFASRKLFLAGALIGSIVGLGRIVQGGHFFSDVVISFWVVYFTNVIISHYYQFKLPLNKPACA